MSMVMLRNEVWRMRKGKIGAKVIPIVCAFVLAGCASVSDLVADKEDQLAAAGFVVKPANTEERQAMLRRLPPHHFVQRAVGDQVTYVYADPLVCDCLYVGTQAAYSRYTHYLQQKRLADEQEMTATFYSDPAWNWGMWGPWGPGYGFGPGYGW
jgi:hypothetical protein